MKTVERRYVMTKLGKRDYALPSNDAKKLFRIRFEEDADIGALDGTVRGWVVYEYNRRLTERLDTENGDNWDYWGGPYDSRGEAVNNALRYGFRPAAT